MHETLTKPVVVPVETVADLTPYEETDDPNVKAHIVNPPNNMHIWQPGMSSRDIVNIARLLGKTVTALCGYKFVPVHNPDKVDACDKCMQIAGELMRGAGE